tara:strand:- start:13732 stop:13926 length:195 start_codon:yes stop_codon:yes gene_type:complete
VIGAKARCPQEHQLLEGYLTIGDEGILDTGIGGGMKAVTAIQNKLNNGLKIILLNLRTLGVELQ